MVKILLLIKLKSEKIYRIFITLSLRNMAFRCYHKKVYIERSQSEVSSVVAYVLESGFVLLYTEHR
jgi:hypothetical protein